MAVQNGIAMGHEDYFNRLLDFLQNDPDLVAAGENWTLVWNNNPSDPNEVVLSAPGLAGQDEIFVGFDLRFNIAANLYDMVMRGFTGIIPSAEMWEGHLNPSPDVRFFLDASPFEYWFVANGRRVLMAHRISTVYQSAHAGLILPYAQPPSYPYPLLVGGTTGESSRSDATTWRSTSTDHNDYLHGFRSTTTGNVTSSPAYLIDPNGAWRPLSGTLSGASGSVVFNDVMCHPYESGPDFITRNAPASEEALTEQISAYGGDFATQPVTLFQSQPTNQVFGILDGVLACQGVNNVAENILTIDGVQHLVLQNTFRAAGHDYHAIRLQ